MIRVTTVLPLLAFLFLAALSDTLPAAAQKPPATPAAKQYQALLDQYDEEGPSPLFAKQFLELAQSHPQDPVAVEALLWIVKNVPGRSDTTRAIELLRDKYVDSEQLASACESIAKSRSIAAEPLLRGAMEKSPHAAVRARACYYLAALLDAEAGVIEQLKAAPQLAPRVLQYYGRDYGQHLASLNSEQIDKEREAVYQTLRDSYGEVPWKDATLGEIARKALFGIQHLSVDKAAPEIEGEDIQGQRFKLSDYRGKVVMLSFWGDW